MSSPQPAPKHAKVLILGSGPAGYSAAVYAAWRIWRRCSSPASRKAAS